MNDPRRPQRFGPPLSGYGPTGPQVPPIRRPPTRLTPTSRRMHPRTAVTFPRRGLQEGPAKASPVAPRPPRGQSDPTAAAVLAIRPAPTGRISPDGLTPPPPQGPRTPRWLWFAAGSAVLLVVALVIALVIANGSVKKQTAIEPLPPCPGLARHVRPRPHRPHPHPAPHRHRQLRPVRPVRRSPARCKPLSTTSRGKAGQSASRTWIAATSYRPSSTSPCRGGKRSACQSRPCIPLASRSSTSATTSPARSPWPGFRYASAPGRG